MALRINLRHLEKHELELKGDLSLAELDLEITDELITLSQPLAYDLVVQSLEDSVLVRGRLELPLACECARCLKPFDFKLTLADWACHLPLEGDEAVVVDGDSIDLTPFLREDMILELPQHPLCKPDCGGLQKPNVEKITKSSADRTKESSAWAELNKLKF